jgi:hypothetical protein
MKISGNPNKYQGYSNKKSGKRVLTKILGAAAPSILRSLFRKEKQTKNRRNPN